jgi:aldehyde dehydrogenase (NAD+)
MPVDVLLETHDLLIGGARVPAASGRYFETFDPATEQVIARVAEAGAADTDAAVRSARAAFEGDWGQRMSAAERGHALLRLADLIRKNENELVELESLDSGKPVSSIRRQDFPAVLDTLTYYAGWADKINGQVIPARRDALTYTVREPMGVVGAIIPWNFPLMIGMWKIAPALACGCTVVLKPAELTPLTALRIGELALAAGFPPGVLNVVPGFGKTAGAALVDHPDVDKVTFTGSPAVGRQILRAAAGNLKRVTLELGGKTANIIFPDADIARVHRFARRLKAGTVWVNTFGPTDVRLPWGGARDSGFGREHGEAAIENFTESKTVWINTGR